MPEYQVFPVGMWHMIGAVMLMIGCVSITIMLLSILKISHATADEAASRGYDQLMPMAHTYVTLMLCADTAMEFEEDEDASHRFGNKAHRLIEQSISLGWNMYQISAATLEATENPQGVELRDDDTPETFSVRHYSGQPCTNALSRAAAMLKDEELPRPIDS